MFQEYLEFFLKKYNIKVEKFNNRYVTVQSKSGRKIRIWFDGRIQIDIKKFVNFSEDKLKKILLDK